MSRYFYRVFSYHFIDPGDRGAFQPLTKLLLEQAEPAPDFEVAVGRMFELAGWEGDGKIEYFYVPPFFHREGRSYFGFHVKQSNNGTSYFAINTDCNLKINEQGEFQAIVPIVWHAAWPIREV